MSSSAVRLYLGQTESKDCKSEIASIVSFLVSSGGERPPLRKHVRTNQVLTQTGGIPSA